MVSFEEFKKLDLRVASIEDVIEHPNADKLLLLSLDVGEEEPVQAVAGIKGHYEPEELKGMDVVALRNMEEATIRGEKSESMVLAATAGEDVVLLTPDPNREVPAGTSIE